MKILKSALFLVALSLSIQAFTAETTSALDVGYEGYFRSRGNLLYNLDLDRDTSPNFRGYTDFRFRLNPTFYITDKVRVRSSFNLVDGVLGDKPYRVKANSNPATESDPTLPNESVLGHNIASLSNSPTGGVYSPDGQVDSQDLTPIQMRRVWLEVDFAYGTLKVGRMPNQFGFGLFANAGDEVSQEFGSSRDRITFESSLGNYYVKPGIGWQVEGALDSSSDDSMDYFVVFGKKDDNQEVAFYLSYNLQNGYRAPADVTQTSIGDAKTGFWAFDFFARHQFSQFDLGTEAVIFSGKANGQNLLAVNAVVRGGYAINRFHLLSEVGYSMGTSAADTADNNLHTVAFSRDYDVSQIVFEEGLPGNQIRNAGGAVTGPGVAPHSGAISNAIYGRAKLSWKAASFFEPAINIVVPYAAKQAGAMKGRFYGVEYDLITLWPFNDYITGEASFAHFLPGSVYESLTPAQSTLAARLGVVAKF